MRSGHAIDIAIPFFVKVVTLPDEVTPPVEHINGNIFNPKAIYPPCIVVLVSIGREGIGHIDGKLGQNSQRFCNGVGTSPCIVSQQCDGVRARVVIAMGGIRQVGSRTVTEIPNKLIGRKRLVVELKIRAEDGLLVGGEVEIGQGIWEDRNKIVFGDGRSTPFVGSSRQRDREGFWGSRRIFIAGRRIGRRSVAAITEIPEISIDCSGSNGHIGREIDTHRAAPIGGIGREIHHREGPNVDRFGDRIDTSFVGSSRKFHIIGSVGGVGMGHRAAGSRNIVTKIPGISGNGTGRDRDVGRERRGHSQTNIRSSEIRHREGPNVNRFGYRVGAIIVGRNDKLHIVGAMIGKSVGWILQVRGAGIEIPVPLRDVS